METLGNVGHQLHGEFVYILSDDSLEVVEGIAPHVSKILKVLTNGKVVSSEQHVRPDAREQQCAAQQHHVRLIAPKKSAVMYARALVSLTDGERSYKNPARVNFILCGKLWLTSLPIFAEFPVALHS